MCSFVPSGASTAQCQASERWLNPRQRQPACLPGRLALQQAVFTATSGRKGSDYHEEYIQRINQRGGRETARDRLTERGVWLNVVVSLVLLNLYTHTHMHVYRHTHGVLLAGDVGPKSSLVFQFQSSPQPRSNKRAGN